MGKKLGFGLEEILLVCHGSDHNDTIVVVERKLEQQHYPEVPYSQIRMFDQPKD